MFHSSPAHAEQALGELARQGFAAAQHLQAGGARAPVQPASSSSRQVAGVACITVAPCVVEQCGEALRRRRAVARAGEDHAWRRPTAGRRARARRCRTTASSPTPAIAGRDARLALHRSQEVDDRAVLDLHALGLSRRTRGVDHVGERAWRRGAGGAAADRASISPASVSSAITRAVVAGSVGRSAECVSTWLKAASAIMN